MTKITITHSYNHDSLSINIDVNRHYPILTMVKAKCVYDTCTVCKCQ